MRNSTKKINFLIKLFNKEVIKIVEPSEEIKEAYIIKSEDSLKSAKILLENNQFNDSISLAYYSMYYMTIALLAKTGIKCENHSATIIILKELFNQDNSKISYAKTERIDKQYYIDFKITKQDTINLIRMTEEFNTTLNEFINRLTEKETQNYLKEIKETLND